MSIPQQTKEDIETIKKQKFNFANDFIDAVSNQSIEKCKKLILSLEELTKLAGDVNITAEQYDEKLDNQCKEFFDKNKKFFANNKNRLLEEAVDSSTIYGLGDKLERVDGLYFYPIKTLSIQMQKKILQNGTISNLGFQIENPIFIDSKIRINNFMLVRAYESIDNTINIKNQSEKAGFKNLKTDEYLKIMKEQNFEDYREYTGCKWFVYEGDLTISSDEFNAIDSGSSLLITGDLIVEGVLFIEDKQIFVLGDVKAKSIIVECSTLYIGGVASFDEVLVAAIGDGEPIVINDTEGKFVVRGVDSADIHVSKEKVDALLDHVYGQSFGDFEKLLDSSVIEVDEEGELDIELDVLYDRILNNKSIIRK